MLSLFLSLFNCFQLLCCCSIHVEQPAQNTDKVDTEENDFAPFSCSSSVLVSWKTMPDPFWNFMSSSFPHCLPSQRAKVTGKDDFFSCSQELGRNPLGFFGKEREGGRRHLVSCPIYSHCTPKRRRKWVGLGYLAKHTCVPTFSSSSWDGFFCPQREKRELWNVSPLFLFSLPRKRRKTNYVREINLLMR